MSRPTPRQAGFTLIELLVVIAIVSLLIALLLPSLQHARYITKILLCKTQLRQFAVGMRTYATDHNQWYPHGTPNPRHYFNQLNMNGQDDITPLIQPYFADHGEYAPDLLVCPLARHHPNLKNGVPPWDLRTSYYIYPNAFGRSSITGHGGANYSTTIASLVHERIKHRVEERFKFNIAGSPAGSPDDPEYNLIASDISKVWNNSPVLNHRPPGTTYFKAHPYTNTYSWDAASNVPGGANYVREDGSVFEYSGITFNSWPTNFYRGGASATGKDLLPIEEQSYH